MNQSKENFYRGVFAVAAIYDIILGIAFMFFHKGVFKMLAISEKAEGSGPYLALIGAFLFALGIGYAYVTFKNLDENKGLILIGSFFKFAYFITALWYYAIDQLPHISFLAVFGVIDLIMGMIMLQCFVTLNRK